MNQVLEILKKARRVLVVTHVRPDGDAVGSCAALVMGLAKVSIRAEVLLLSELPAKLAFIFEQNGIRWTQMHEDRPASVDLGAYDTLVSVDTGTWSQLPGLKEHLTAFVGPKLVIDHHVTQEDWANEKWVDTQAAAAGEMIAQLLQSWPISIDQPIATALWVALASDTGWFEFSNTRPQTLRLAASLMELGVDTDQVYQHLYQSERAARLKLQARVIDSMELLCDGRLALMKITQDDLRAAGADVTDADNLINLALQIGSVQVAALFTESSGHGPTRVSLRSKGQVDVARFAEGFGGGGHARAAGLKVHANLEDAHHRIATALSALF